eukprot:CAMPEP_0201922468 /NCGR_PEP_ID=MMETSP0903-20130614/10494_1 /ASSEMBLY_ACC=CAM_ASM_000552 /TAXON_ID=420261 /ORGANISM="Thalassiosira antarctica, Strain CCMP982" /LENGTH=426 /DNA_ID=CAMNT_0048459613 /DNA_START=251 /DNA_END=1528 /DNA_ORIENTATION=-
MTRGMNNVVSLRASTSASPALNSTAFNQKTESDNTKPENNRLHHKSRKYNAFLFVLVACLFVSFQSMEYLIGAAIAGPDAVVPSRLSLRKSNETQHHENIIEAVLDTTYTPSSFWSSLDLQGEINCGKYKCLFRQKVNHHGEGGGDHEQIAYLVGNNFRGYQFEAEWETTWKFAQYLQSTFHIKHLFLEAPRRVMVLPTALELFTNRTWRTRPKEPMYTGGQYAIVQKVRLAPNPRVIVMERKWTAFQWLFREKAVNKTSFISTFRKDIDSALDALEAAPLLAQDFQIMIDGEGNIYQFDLDRVFLGGVYGHERFQKKFVKAYDGSTDILRRMAVWAWQQKGLNGENNHWKTRDSRHGEAVLTDNLGNSSSLSCKAMNTVIEMSGRKGQEIEMTRDAKLMMVHLVETVMFDGGQYDGPGGSEDGIW